MVKAVKKLVPYVGTAVIFLLLGFAISYGMSVFADTNPYPAGKLYSKSGTYSGSGGGNDFYCDSGYSLWGFRYNEGKDNDANWWECQAN